MGIVSRIRDLWYGKHYFKAVCKDGKIYCTTYEDSKLNRMLFVVPIIEIELDGVYNSTLADMSIVIKGIK